MDSRLRRKESEDMKEILETFKTVPIDQISAYCLPVKVNGQLVGRLRPVTSDCLQNQAEIRMITDWRRASEDWFTSQFPVSEDGTREWIRNQILHADDRILFIIEDMEQNPIGHVGFCHYDQEKQTCEYDNLVRGRKGQFAIFYALLAFGDWSFRVLDLQKAYLNVLADNIRALQIYQNLGFEEVQKVPLMKAVEGDVTRWVPAEGQPEGEVERYLVTMMIKRAVFFNTYEQTS
jgi:RimJ/RimL family protein N-acetyltransferase